MENEEEREGTGGPFVHTVFPPQTQFPCRTRPVSLPLSWFTKTQAGLGPVWRISRITGDRKVETVDTPEGGVTLHVTATAVPVVSLPHPARLSGRRRRNSHTHHLSEDPGSRRDHPDTTTTYNRTRHHEFTQTLPEPVLPQDPNNPKVPTLRHRTDRTEPWNRSSTSDHDGPKVTRSVTSGGFTVLECV